MENLVKHSDIAKAFPVLNALTSIQNLKGFLDLKIDAPDSSKREYADEIEYSAKVGIMEAMASGLLYTPDIIKYVMKKYKGHMNPAVVEEILGDPQISRVGPDPFTQLPHLPMNADTINIIIP